MYSRWPLTWLSHKIQRIENRNNNAGFLDQILVKQQNKFPNHHFYNKRNCYLAFPGKKPI
jgi:hypothetical protein